jgi:1,5-anhydro-D-fructose reductase (1,5-anhydro-D-mannitol-forming)
MLRYGILGFGLHAEKRLMFGFTLTERSQPVAFWRNNPAKSAQTAQRYRLHSHASPEELCADPQVDAVFVTSPDALHLEHVKLALAAGKPVLCEKPMGMNAAECEQMITAATQAGKLLGVAHVFRFEESVLRTRELVESGRLGRILSARCEFVYPGTNSARMWITDASLACGGPVADVGVHCFDALRFVLQDEVADVNARLQSDELSGSVEANADIALQFAKGTLANVFVTTRAPYRTFLELIGTEASVEVRNCFSVEHPIEINVVQDGKVTERISCQNSRAYALQFDAFADAVTNGVPFACTAEDGLANQRIIDSVYGRAAVASRR